MEAGNYVRSNAPGKNNASKTGDPGNAVKNNEAYSTDAETASSNNAGKPFAPGDAGNHYAYGTACRSTAPTADGKDPGNAPGTGTGNDPGNPPGNYVSSAFALYTYVTMLIDRIYAKALYHCCNFF